MKNKTLNNKRKAPKFSELGHVVKLHGSEKITTQMNHAMKRGKRYDAIVPDTLDLAERAKLGINHFTSIICEGHNYEMPYEGDFIPHESKLGPNPNLAVFIANTLTDCEAKAMEAMVMLRIMSGSRQNLEREAKMVEMLVSMLGNDGLYWVHYNPNKPWLGAKEMMPYLGPGGQATMLRAMIRWYQYTNDSAWKTRIDRMINGLDRMIVVHKDDYAYIPIRGHMHVDGDTMSYARGLYVKGRGWKDTAEPAGEKQKFAGEGSLMIYHMHFPGVLAEWYLLTGNKQALRLSGQLVRFLTKSKFWADWKGGEYPGVVGAEHAHWNGHIHHHISLLWSILKYAIATNDPRLKAFVRDGYEWARQPTLARFGFLGDGQGCGCPRLLGLAIELSDAGVGDYWEDVDMYIRNIGTEMQLTPEDIPWLKECSRKGKPFHIVPSPRVAWISGAVNLMEAGMGSFAGAPFKNGWGICCSSWGNMGLFFAWDGTLRYSGGVVKINLLLNRASPWMDIDSYLPYEGKVVLKNKACREAFVRIPLWVDKKQVGCRIGKRTVHPEWFGRYAWFRHLKRGDVVTIEFPVIERTEQWTGPAKETWGGGVPGDTLWKTCGNKIQPWAAPQPAAKTPTTFKLRGNTIIQTSQPLLPNSPLFQMRPIKYRVTKAPLKKVERFVTPLILKW